MGGGVDPRELGFLHAFVLFFHIWNDSWTEDMILLSPGGARSTFETHPVRDWPVGGVEHLHSVRRIIYPGDISVFILGLSELYTWYM